MKTIFVTVLLALLPITTALSRQGAKAGKQRMTGSVEQLLMQMEHDWAKAIIDRDAAKIRDIVAPDFVLTTPDATLSDRESDLAELVSGEFAASFYDASDMKARVFGDCAVLTGQTTVKGEYKGEEIHDQFRWTDTFVKRNGKWQVVASQATRIPASDKK